MEKDTIEIEVNLLEKLMKKVQKLEKTVNVLQAEKKTKQEQVIQFNESLQDMQQKIRERNAQVSDTTDPLTACGVINSAIGHGIVSDLIPYEFTPSTPNFFDCLPPFFGINPELPDALILTITQFAQLMYSSSIASKWFTTGQKPSWQQSVLDRNGGYNKGAEIREYTPDDHAHVYVYWISLADNNKSPRPTISSHVNWDWIFCIDINGLIHFNHDIFVPKVTITNSNNGFITECNGDSITIRDQNLNRLMSFNGQHLEFYNTLGILKAYYALDGSSAPISRSSNFYDTDHGKSLGEVSSMGIGFYYEYDGLGSVTIYGNMSATSGGSAVAIGNVLNPNLPYVAVATANIGGFDGYAGACVLLKFENNNTTLEIDVRTTTAEHIPVSVMIKGKLM